jgi:hypothetical protein
VKKVFKISGTVFTAVLYSIAVFLITENALLPCSRFAEPYSTGNRSYFETDSDRMLGVPLTQKTSFHHSTGVKFAGSEFQFKEFSDCIKYAELIVSSEFVQYVFQTKSFPVKLRKADLLFPFHYFW